MAADDNTKKSSDTNAVADTTNEQPKDDKAAAEAEVKKKDKEGSNEVDADIKEELERFHEGKENSHNALDGKDERTNANKVAAASKDKDDNESEKKLSDEEYLSQVDPTMPARLHGNEPSKGAKIDAEIMDEEKELIAKMDAKKEQSQKAKHK